MAASLFYGSSLAYMTPKGTVSTGKIKKRPHSLLSKVVVEEEEKEKRNFVLMDLQVQAMSTAMLLYGPGSEQMPSHILKKQHKLHAKLTRRLEEMDPEKDSEEEFEVVAPSRVVNRLTRSELESPFNEDENDVELKDIALYDS